MISPPSAQQGTISRRLEHKSFISKPLESKTRSSLFPMEWLLGLPEGSRTKRCPGSGPLPVSRVSAPIRTLLGAPNRRDPGLLFLQPCTRPSRGPPRRLPVVPSIQIKGTTGRLRGCSGEAGAAEVGAGGRGRCSHHSIESSEEPIIGPQAAQSHLLGRGLRPQSHPKPISKPERGDHLLAQGFGHNANCRT
jgi:hypothetical protein